MNKWDKTKKYIKELPANAKELVSKAMKKNPDKVKYITKKEIKFWEYSFRMNGFDCFLQYQTGGKEDIYRIMAFNNDENVCYIREPLKEDLMEQAKQA